MQYPIIPCDLCGSQPDSGDGQMRLFSPDMDQNAKSKPRWFATPTALSASQNSQVKQILDQWEQNSPGRRQVMFRALMNVRPSHLVDPKLFDFAGLMRDPDKFELNSDDIPDLR